MSTLMAPFRRGPARPRPPRDPRGAGRRSRGRGAPAARLSRPAVRSRLPRASTRTSGRCAPRARSRSAARSTAKASTSGAPYEPWLGPLKQALGPVLDACPDAPDAQAWQIHHSASRNRSARQNQFDAPPKSGRICARRRLGERNMRLVTASPAFGLLASTMLCSTGAAFAQDPPAAGRPRPPTAQASEDEADIIVTAHAARGESAGRADRDHRARHRDARRAAGRRFRRLCPLRPEPLLPLARARARPTSISAASPRARTPTTRPRCPASAPISTSSRSRRSPARSTSTSSTSPGSRRWPGRRARSTAPRARPARSASSPTGPTRRASTAPPTSS